MGKYIIGARARVVANGDPRHGFSVGDEVEVVKLHNSMFGVVRCRRFSDGAEQWVNERALEPLVHKIVITTDGETTTARMFAGKEQVKSATAKCSKSDTFCFETGAALAMERLLAGEEKRAPKFTKADLKDGMFCRLGAVSWFVIVGNLAVFEDGDYCHMDELEEDLSWYVAGPIEVVLEGVECFDSAKLQSSGSRHVRYVRPGVEF